MTAPGELERGTRLGKYEIHGRLSVGGMAELYLASLAGQGGFRKFVALKRVLPTIAANEDFTTMFLDEARITAALSHAGIAQVFELAEDPDSHEPMLAMEFVAGQNVEQIVRCARKKKVPLPLGFIARLANDVLLALHYAHGFVEPVSGKPMPVVHRDINPRNVMVTYAGSMKLIDFGIAKARGRLNQTHVGFVKGTLRYMAPEQVTAKAIDGRTDLFAASILFYELLSGRPLFDDESDAALMTRIALGTVPDLATAAPRVPPEVAAVVMKGLARDPDQRWQTGREYARALDRAMPEPFDEQQVGELMASLFEDKIAVTRGLLSSAQQASPSDLRLMTMMGDEDEPPTGVISDVTPLGAQTEPARRAAMGDVTSQPTLDQLTPVPPRRPAPRPRSRPDLGPSTAPRPRSNQELALYAGALVLAMALIVGVARCLM